MKKKNKKNISKTLVWTSGSDNVSEVFRKEETPVFIRKNKNVLGKTKKKTEESKSKSKIIVNVPLIEKGVLRIIPLGGVEQVGQNMTVIEYEDDIIIIDAGLEFAREDTPGVDYKIPNIRYLEKFKNKIKGLFITHGHYDHIGAIPHIMDKIGNPPIYVRKFGAMMILKRQEEFPNAPKLNVKILDDDTKEVKISKNFKIIPFPISHTIPDSTGFIIKTPLGEIAFIEDVRVDNINGIPTQEEIEQYKRFFSKEVLLLTLDSTSVEKPGFSISESVVVENIEKIIKNTFGRIIIATFASQIERIIAIIDLAEKYGRKVIIEGRSMRVNTDIAKLLNLIKSKNIVSIENIETLPPNKVLVLATGAQGEEFAALMRIANKTHRYIHLQKTDTVLLSSSVIPGNELAIAKLKDNLYRSGAKIITYLDSDIHASGHGNRGELKWIHQQIKYRFFMPVHGHHYMLRQHAELAMSLGVSEENIIVPDNGSVIEIYDEGNKIRVLKEKAPVNISVVDGFSVGDTQEVVIRDRQMLAQDGMFVVIAVIDLKTRKLKKSPDLISRGFIYLRESQPLLYKSRQIIKKTIEEEIKNSYEIDTESLKSIVTDNVSRFLFKETGKKPLVIPVIISV